MVRLRKANLNDHDFLVRIDLKNDGYTISDKVNMTFHAKEEHREKIKRFLTDDEKGTFVYDDSASNKSIAMIMYNIANRDIVYPWKTIFNELERTLFQSDGRFMEIFGLWVHPEFRR